MNILAFGDSITWGACDDEGGGWATRLRNKLAGKDIDVYNCGISGDNTDDLLFRFKVEAEARKSKDETVVIFAIGINDSQYTGSRDNTRVRPEKFTQNLSTLIQQAKEVGSSILFIGLNRVEDEKLTPIPWSNKDQNYDNENVGLYNSLVRKAADDNQLPFLDISELITEADLEDGLHPNTSGHQKLAEAIEEFLNQQGIVTS